MEHDLQSIMSIAAAAMQDPEFLGSGGLEGDLRGAASTARIELVVPVMGFFGIWFGLERRLREDMAAGGQPPFGLMQMLRVWVLTLLLAMIIDGNVLHAALGDGGPLLAREALTVASQAAPSASGEVHPSGQTLLLIERSLVIEAWSTVLSGALIMGFAIVVVAALASPVGAPGGMLRKHRSDWIALAFFLGMLGYPAIADGPSLAAIGGDVEPLLRREAGL